MYICQQFKILTFWWLSSTQKLSQNQEMSRQQHGEYLNLPQILRKAAYKELLFWPTSLGQFNIVIFQPEYGW